MARPKLTDTMPGMTRHLDSLWDTERKLAEQEGREPKAVRVWRAFHGNVLKDPPRGKRPSRTWVEHYLREGSVAPERGSYNRSTGIPSPTQVSTRYP